jgi:uncharacterized protein with HEPN domain
MDYMQGVDEESFMSSSMLQDAIIRQISIIGEAGTHISDKTRVEHPDIPWRKIIGMRNMLMHQYFGTDLAFVFTTATERIPELAERVEQIITSSGRK